MYLPGMYMYEKGSCMYACLKTCHLQPEPTVSFGNQAPWSQNVCAPFDGKYAIKVQEETIQ